MKKELLSLLVLFISGVFHVYAQTLYSGKVVSVENTPLPYATVYLQGGIVSANKEGEFKIKATGTDSLVLKITYLGYETFLKVVVPGNLNIELGTLGLKQSNILTKEVTIVSTRADKITPITATEISKEEISRANLGQDLPYIMSLTPSVVASSDGGNGIGYTNLRLRGSDLTRINVTINGVPLNDPESQGVFFVNLPDLASSTESIQIQRGVGTSSNGAGAFGGSINIATNNIDTKASAAASVSYGSYNSKKLTAMLNTGLLNNKWLVEARLSKIGSDGYIDRASANLNSAYLAASYLGKKTTLKLIHLNGKEITYQSWYGTPQSRVEGNKEDMMTHASNNYYSEVQNDNLLSSGRTYNYYTYKNQVDNYGQAHYQMIWNQYLSENFKFNMTGHYTKGRGYFEEYKLNQNLVDYGFQPLPYPLPEGDLVRRRWLDNDFYGAVYSLNFVKNKFDITLGGSLNQYDGDHFGEIIWAQYLGNLNTEQRYYFNQSKKVEVSNYLKTNYRIKNNINFYVDLQFRNIQYQGKGKDNDQKDIDFKERFNFFNPKIGLNYEVDQNNSFYGSIAQASHEPIRSDFVDQPANIEPKAEKLNNLEIGYKRNYKSYQAIINFYWMAYQNQLIATGAVNDVGSSLRTNVQSSYRKGLEMTIFWNLNERLAISGNIAFSKNKVDNFREVIYNSKLDGSTEEIINEYKKTDIAFSPNLVAGGEFRITPIRQLSIGFLSKYVGDQFLDNTSNEARKINAYFTEDIRMVFAPKLKGLNGVEFSFQVNNLLNNFYENNGYTYTYQYEYINNDLGLETQKEEVTENFYYPQAEINYMVGLTVKF